MKKEIVTKIIKEQLSRFNMNDKKFSISNNKIIIEDVGIFLYDSSLNNITFEFIFYLCFASCLSAIRNYYAVNKSDHCFSDQQNEFIGTILSAVYNDGKVGMKSFRAIDIEGYNTKSGSLDAWWYWNNHGILFEYEHIHSIGFKRQSYKLKTEIFNKYNKLVNKFSKMKIHKRHLWNVPDIKGLILVNLEGLVFRWDTNFNNQVSNDDYSNIIKINNSIITSNGFTKPLNFSFLWLLDKNIVPLSRKDHYRLCPSLGFIARVDNVSLQEHQEIVNEI